MLLSEKFDELFSFELDFPYENLFNFHKQGTFSQETEKSSSKLFKFLIRPSHQNKLGISASAHTLQIVLELYKTLTKTVSSLSYKNEAS